MRRSRRRGRGIARRKRLSVVAKNMWEVFTTALETSMGQVDLEALFHVPYGVLVMYSSFLLMIMASEVTILLSQSPGTQ